MNQMGSQSPALDPPLMYKAYNQIRKVFHDVFHKFHATAMTTQKCDLSMGITILRIIPQQQYEI